MKKLSANQKAFNKAARHLLKQNCKSMLPNTSICAYRGANKTRCAIGALIPDRLYDKSMESSTPYGAKVYDTLASLGYNDIEFNVSLQRVHDNKAPEKWRKALEEFAEERGLVWPKGL